MKNFIINVLIILFSFSIYAQNYDEYIVAANRHVKEGNYQSAQEIYDIYVELSGRRDVELEQKLKRNVKISGIVTNYTGEPVIGAYVTLEGNNSVGTITDFDGYYEILVKLNDRLIFSFNGYESQTLSVLGKSTLNVILKENKDSRRAEIVSQDYVDMGLPSGTKWKIKNEGGDRAYYKYKEAVKYFGKHLPSKDQFKELKEECTWIWTGSGYKVVGPNGNSIYLPAAGYRGCIGDNELVNRNGCYWSLTRNSSVKVYSLSFFTKQRIYITSEKLCIGQSVRLVK
jgi:hypothetical protein